MKAMTGRLTVDTAPGVSTFAKTIDPRKTVAGAGRARRGSKTQKHRRGEDEISGEFVNAAKRATKKHHRKSVDDSYKESSKSEASYYDEEEESDQS